MKSKEFIFFFLISCLLFAGCSHQLVFNFRNLHITNIEITDCVTDETIVLDSSETNYLISLIQDLTYREEEDYSKITSMFVEGNAIYELIFYTGDYPTNERIVILWDNLIFYDNSYFESQEPFDLEYIQNLFETGS